MGDQAEKKLLSGACRMTWRILPALMLFLHVAPASRSELPSFVRAVDLSFLQQLEDAGVVYNSNGQAGDLIHILKSNGVNCVRLRLWHTPTIEWCNLSNTLVVAQRVHDAGLAILLDIHYSDSWADPGQQTKPAAWQFLSFTELQQAVQDYTTDVITNFSALGFLPDGVQIGNEITSGFLWNEGRVRGSYETNWVRFSTLLKSAITGITNNLSPGDDVDIILHIDQGADNSLNRKFFDRIVSNNVPFDIIGLSYYPWWHGSLEDLFSNIADLSNRYGKDIIVMETAYPWTLEWSDLTHNIIGETWQLLEGFPAEPAGQLDFLCAVRNIVSEAGGEHGRGICYWAPDFVAAQGVGSPVENLAVFNFATNLLPAALAFTESNEPCMSCASWLNASNQEFHLRFANLSPNTTANVTHATSLIGSSWSSITNVVSTNWAPFMVGPVYITNSMGFFRLEQ